MCLFTYPCRFSSLASSWYYYCTDRHKSGCQHAVLQVHSVFLFFQQKYQCFTCGCFRKNFGLDLLQPCCIPLDPINVDIHSRGLIGGKVICRKSTFAFHIPQVLRLGGLEMLSSTTIVKVCGVSIKSRGYTFYFLKSYLRIPTLMIKNLGSYYGTES